MRFFLFLLLFLVESALAIECNPETDLMNYNGKFEVQSPFQLPFKLVEFEVRSIVIGEVGGKPLKAYFLYGRNELQSEWTKTNWKLDKNPKLGCLFLSTEMTSFESQHTYTEFHFTSHFLSSETELYSERLQSDLKEYKAGSEAIYRLAKENLKSQAEKYSLFLFNDELRILYVRHKPIREPVSYRRIR